jgi:hypothetical protein
MNIGDDVGNSKARWVRVSVEMLSHPALDHGPFDRRSAWLWLITSAATRDKTVSHKGQPFPLKRGQVLAGRAYLAKVWDWSEKQVRVFLDLLTSENMVEKGQSNGHFANVLTISNYGKYQDVPLEKDQKKGQSTASAGPVQGQTVTGNTYNTGSEVTPPTPPSGGMDDMPSHVRPITNWAQAFRRPEETHGIVVNGEKVELVNTTRVEWLERFKGDAQALDLALIQVSIQPNSRTPIRQQVDRQLARMAAERHDRDQRYQAAAARSNASPRGTAQHKTGKPSLRDFLNQPAEANQ